MKKTIRFIFLLITFVTLFAESIFAQSQTLKLSYDFPAKDWESEALPLGNGNMGCMVFGDVAEDIIQMNEHSLWSGGPGKNENYDGGHLRTASENHQTLQYIRQTLQEKMTEFSNNDAAYIDEQGNVVAKNYSSESKELDEAIRKLMGTKEDFGSYQSLSNLNIAYLNPTTSDFSGYLRELDIENAILTITYSQAGINYKREYFVNHPNNVLVVRLSADKPASLSRQIWLTSKQMVDFTLQPGMIAMRGRPNDHSSRGLRFAQRVKVIPTGGSMREEGNRIFVENADEIIILSTAATNYQQCMDNSFNYFSSVNPVMTVGEEMEQISSLSYNELLNTHKTDYQSLFARMNLSLSEAQNVNNKTTDKLLEGYKKGTNSQSENQYLEQLYFQFGRYLLIASSRKSGLPANLQGIWAEGLNPPWGADYHTNINVQMNYWLAQQTNLADCHWPIVDYVKSLVPRGKYTAQHYYCRPDGSPVRGWVIHHENTIWGNTAPGVWYEGFYFPAAAAWMCQDLWEYFQFNQDKEFLEEYYPILLDAALFWVDNLWRDSRDGTLVANPSYSPEHGPYSLGASSDQAIITELFDMVLKASAILGKDTPEMKEVMRAKSKLAGPQIGLAGQFMEWKDEVRIDITGDNQHRHVNHLFWLHPGSQIVPGKSPQDDLYVEAMKQTLNTRGDGGTGWSKAWKINFWARLRDGNRSHKLLQEQLKESTLTNLFDTHPPFQIDGNFGATAGMTEMLVQSQAGYIEILPALPEAWNTGSFKGIKARGNFELDAKWSNNELSELKIISNSGKDCEIKYPGISQYVSAELTGVTILDADKIKLETVPGGIYTLKRQ